MLKIKLILLFIILLSFMNGCGYSPNSGPSRKGQAVPSINISSTLILQGTIKKEDIRTNKKNVLIKSKQGFNLHEIVRDLGSWKIDDIYIEKTENLVVGVYQSNYDYLPELLTPYEITMSNNFEGTAHVFMIFTSHYDAGSYTGRGDFWRDLTYGPKLATALKNTHGITHMGKNNTYPVGAGEPVVIDHTAEPDSVRALMKAAITTGDPRLLVIERKAGDAQVSITAFGKEKKIDAGETYEWKFGEAQLNELRKLVVRR